MTPHVLGTLWVGVVAAGPRHPVQALVQVADVLVAEHRAVAVVDTRHLLLNNRCQGFFASRYLHNIRIRIYQDMDVYYWASTSKWDACP